MDYWSEKLKDPEFRSLRDEWYEKARASGLNDVEIIDKRTGDIGDSMYGPSVGDLNRSESRRDNIFRSEEYYRQARQYMYYDCGRNRIEDPEERTIWQAHCEGKSALDILDMFGERMGISLHKVKSTITKHRGKMLYKVHKGL